MQNQNQDKPNYDQYPPEIDLVDLAAVMYRRKVTLVLVVLVSIVLATGYWFSLGEKIQVTAVFNIGEAAIISSGVPISSPLMSASDSAQLLELVYLPSLRKSNKLETGTRIARDCIKIKYKGSEKNYESTTAVLELLAIGSKKDAQALGIILDGSLELLQKKHTEILEKQRSGLNDLIEIQKSKLLLLKQLSTKANPNQGLSQMPLVEANIISLESLLAISTNSTILQTGLVKSVESKGPAVYVVSGFVFGLFFGCFLVFTLELYDKAKIRAAETFSL